MNHSATQSSFRFTFALAVSTLRTGILIYTPGSDIAMRTFVLAVAMIVFSLQQFALAADPPSVPVPPAGQLRQLNGPPLGQWQIYRVEVSSPAGSKASDQRNAFYTVLLDSATGETWLLTPKNKDGTPLFVWVRIDREPK
jgi:hypothetical protein